MPPEPAAGCAFAAVHPKRRARDHARGKMHGEERCQPGIRDAHDRVRIASVTPDPGSSLKKSLTARWKTSARRSIVLAAVAASTASISSGFAHRRHHRHAVTAERVSLADLVIGGERDVRRRRGQPFDDVHERGIRKRLAMPARHRAVTLAQK